MLIFYWYEALLVQAFWGTVCNPGAKISFQSSKSFSNSPHTPTSSSVPQKRCLWCSLSAMGWTCRGRNFCCSYIPFNLRRSRFSRKTLISGTGPACFWGVYSPLEIIKTRVRFAFHPLPSKPSLCKSQPPLKFKMCVTVCNWLTEWSLQTLFSSLSCLRNRELEVMI